MILVPIAAGGGSFGGDFAGASLSDSNATPVYTSTSGTGVIPTPSYSFSDLLNSRKTNMTRQPLSEYKLKHFNGAVTGGVGISGVCYIPEVGLWLFVDNNAVNISIYQEDDFTTEWGNVTLTGFTDPECCEYLWTIYDANGQPSQAVLAIGEEALTEISLVTISLTNTAQAVTRGSFPIINPSNMWADDAGFGMEALTFDPFRNMIYAFKKGATSGTAPSLEFRAIPLNGSLTPTAIEPFDAAAAWSATIPAVNDATFDYTTRTILLIGDRQGADTSEQDIIRVEPISGTILESYQNYVDTLGLNANTATDWPQGEGIGITPDGRFLVLSSEGDSFCVLERVAKLSKYSNVRTVAGNAAQASNHLRSDDSTVLVDASATNTIFNLLTATNFAGILINVKKIDSSVNTVTIDAAGAETIDGTATIVLSVQNQSATLHSNGSGTPNWVIV